MWREILLWLFVLNLGIGSVPASMSIVSSSPSGTTFHRPSGPTRG